MDDLDKRIIEAYDEVANPTKVDEQYKDITEIMNVDNAFDNVMDRRSDMLIALNRLEAAMSKIPAKQLGKDFNTEFKKMKKNNHSLKKELQYLYKKWSDLSKYLRV